MGKEIVLFFHIGFTTFVKNDFDILSEKYIVKDFKYELKKSAWVNIISQIKMFFWIFYNLWTAKAFYIWFADYHSFLPILFGKIFRKKTYLVLGGYDVTYIPEIDYGALKNPLRAFCARFSIKNAYMNLSVCDNIADDARKISSSANIRVLYTGYSKEKFFPGNEIKEKSYFNGWCRK